MLKMFLSLMNVGMENVLVLSHCLVLLVHLGHWAVACDPNGLVRHQY